MYGLKEKIQSLLCNASGGKSDWREIILFFVNTYCQIYVLYFETSSKCNFSFLNFWSVYIAFRLFSQKLHIAHTFQMLVLRFVKTLFSLTLEFINVRTPAFATPTITFSMGLGCFRQLLPAISQIWLVGITVEMEVTDNNFPHYTAFHKSLKLKSPKNYRKMWVRWQQT